MPAVTLIPRTSDTLIDAAEHTRAEQRKDCISAALQRVRSWPHAVLSRVLVLTERPVLNAEPVIPQSGLIQYAG